METAPRKNPKKIKLNIYDKHKQFLPFVEKYRQIVPGLDRTNTYAVVIGLGYEENIR